VAPFRGYNVSPWAEAMSALEGNCVSMPRRPSVWCARRVCAAAAVDRCSLLQIWRASTVQNRHVWRCPPDWRKLALLPVSCNFFANRIMERPVVLECEIYLGLQKAAL
jgi:hypothetical protein